MKSAAVAFLLFAVLILPDPCLSQSNVVKTGLMDNYSIDTKLFSKKEDYFKATVPNKFYKACKNNEVPSGWETEKETPEKSVGYGPGEHTTVVFVPANYDGNSAFGIYLHVSPSKQGISPSQEWQALMEKLKLIYISANGTENDSPMWRRVVLGMDSMAMVKKHYKIDNMRVYVGGLSGGGHICMLTQMLYPEYFQGAISHAAQSYLPSERNCGHFPGLTMTDILKEPRKSKKWAVIGGDKDFNYQAILTTTEEWKKTKMKYKYFFVQGMGHGNASAAALEEALIWMGAGKTIPAETGGKITTTTAAEREDIRTWTLKNGKSVEASFVRNTEYYVILQTVSNKTVQLIVQNLSDEDKAYLKGLKKSGPSSKKEAN
jgi:hypothetical protein